MTNLVGLDRVAHRNLRVVEEQAFAVCKDMTMCAVSLNEIARLVIEYPIVFTRASENDDFLCVALFGISPEKNLFWRNGRWDSFSVPMNIGRQPFFVGVAPAQNPDGTAGQQLVTFIDLENPGVQAEAGEPLFDSAGEYSPYLRHKMNMLTELVDGEKRSQAFVKKAVDFGLIHPIQLELKIGGGETRKVTGLFSIDERKLRSLDAAAVEDLNSSGYLHAMYAMLSSLGHLQILARRASAQNLA